MSELGLNIDMTDADRLRDWARNIEDGGLLITAWASPSFLVDRLRDMADRVEQEVRDVGQLRAIQRHMSLTLSDRGVDDGKTLQDVQRRLHVDTPTAMRLFALHYAVKTLVGTEDAASKGTSGSLRSAAKE